MNKHTIRMHIRNCYGQCTKEEIMREYRYRQSLPGREFDCSCLLELIQEINADNEHRNQTKMG